jgi:GT2 family glycosyltransferase
VPEDIFSRLIRFMHETPDAGAVGVKLLNADGSFSVDSRHSVPSPLTAFWKQIGFDRLFPKSRIFGQYNLTYLNPDETYPVDAISGSFMFLRRLAIKQVGLLDEDFFMYCEDLDYCYRLTWAEWKVYYYPGILVLHYKGESTNKNTLRYSFIFNRSLYLYYKKHFHFKFNYLMHVLILTGVILRGMLNYVRHQVKSMIFRIKQRVRKSIAKEKKVIWIGTSAPVVKKKEIVSSAGYQVTDKKLYDTIPVQDIPVLGSLEKLKDFNPPSDIDNWIFDADQLSFSCILTAISNLSPWKINFKIFSSRINSIVSKISSI